MQIIVTRSHSPQSRTYIITRAQVVLLGAFGLLAQLLLATVLTWLVMYMAIKDRWPAVSQIAHAVLAEEMVKRDQYLRENVNTMANKVGELQAQLVRLESLGQRVGSLSGYMQPAQAASKAALPLGSGGPLVPLGGNTTLQQLNQSLEELATRGRNNEDYLKWLESQLLDQRVLAHMRPSRPPLDVPTGSSFGWRIDPFTGQSAMHTGLDFPAPTGSYVHAAAGGAVIFSGWLSDYGNAIEIDHGNGLITRYGHGSKLLVHQGDIVRSGQVIMQSGSSGRSTGAHLHFEVIVNGRFQDPSVFLNLGGNNPQHTARRSLATAAAQ